MPEVQSHGFDFENWVKKTFFADCNVPYTDEWDVPESANDLLVVPTEFRHIPVSIKTCKNYSSIGFGDALIRFRANEDFLLIVGFWEQSGEYKNFVSVEAVKVLKGTWSNLFQGVTDEQISLLDSTIKNREKHYADVRKSAQEIKKSFPSTKITLNPKIDSKTQRRLQCSLPFGTFWSDLAKKESSKNATLFGKPVPNPFLSGARVLMKRKRE